MKFDQELEIYASPNEKKVEQVHEVKQLTLKVKKSKLSTKQKLNQMLETERRENLSCHRDL